MTAVTELLRGRIQVPISLVFTKLILQVPFQRIWTYTMTTTNITNNLIPTIITTRRCECNIGRKNTRWEAEKHTRSSSSDDLQNAQTGYSWRRHSTDKVPGEGSHFQRGRDQWERNFCPGNRNRSLLNSASSVSQFFTELSHIHWASSWLSSDKKKNWASWATQSCVSLILELCILYVSSSEKFTTTTSVSVCACSVAPPSLRPYGL